MSRVYILLLLSVLLFVPRWLHSEENGLDHLSGTQASPRAAHDTSNEVVRIFKSKCIECHENDGSEVFGKDGLPSKEYLKKIEERIKPGASGIMPPEDSIPLTTTERASIDLWLQSQKEEMPTQTPDDPRACYEKLQSKESVSDDSGKALMQKACVMCHSMMQEPMYGEMPWTMIRKIGEDLVKTQHTLFLEEDGSLALSHLGESSESKDGTVPRKRTSIERILNQISGHYMPPKGMSTHLSPELSSKERKDLLRWLNQQKHRENCQLIKPSFVRDRKTSTPLNLTFAEAAVSCQKKGGWLPTSRQIEEFMKNNRGEFQNLKCVWTSSYSGDDKVSRVMWNLEGKGKADSPEKYHASENYTCAALCGEVPKK